MKKEVLKRREMIHIPHTGTLIQGQLWNILIAEAWSEIKDNSTDTHRMTVTTLNQYLPYYTKNYDLFRTAVEALADTKVTFKIIGEKGEGWGFYRLLSEGRFVDGVFEYAFPPSLKEQMRNDDNYYAKISLVIQQKFSSKLSLALYELCFDNRKNNTPRWYTLDEMRHFLDIEGKYKDWRDFRKRISKEAIDEINDVSDITVTYKIKKTGRKITHIQFSATEKKKLLEDLQKVQEEEKPVDYLLSRGLILGITNKKLTDVRKKGYSDRRIEWAFEEIELYEKSYLVKFPDRLFEKIYPLESDWEIKNAKKRAKEWFDMLPEVVRPQMFDQYTAGMEGKSDDKKLAQFYQTLIEVWCGKKDFSEGGKEWWKGATQEEFRI